MYHPTTRTLAVLELLQTHGRLSGSELAQRLGVDVRTLRRYITRLEDLGIPITAERGRYGAYMLVAGFKLPPMMFSNDEALALTVGLLAAQRLGLADGTVAAQSALAKLERVLPAPLKHQPRALAETLALDVRPSEPLADSRALATLSAAAQARRRVHLHYRDARHGDSERDFDAYGLAWRAGRWYTIGWCGLRQALRSFRLDRVRQVQLLEANFERPPAFDVAAQLNFAIASIPRALALEVILHTDLHTALDELHASIGVFEACAAGVRLRTRTDSIDWFARRLAALPCSFEIVTPPALRAAVRTCAERLLRQIEGPPERIGTSPEEWAER